MENTAISDETVFESINWCYGDLRDALRRRGFAATDEEVLKLETASSKSLRDRLAERGNEIIDDMISMDMGNPTARYIAHFRPEAWVNDVGIEVDAEGPTTWDCTDFLRRDENAATFQEVVEVLGDAGQDDWRDDDDVLFKDPAAPGWVRNWRGPFTITVKYGQ